MNQLILTLAILFGAAQAAAQTENYRDRVGTSNPVYNYYGNHNQRAKTLLHSSERVHLLPAIKDQNAVRPTVLYRAMGNAIYVLNKFPNHPDALSAMTKIAITQGNIEMAEARFKKAIDIAPNISNTYLLYGIFKYKTGELDEAVEMYSKAVKLSPKSAEAQYNLGLGYYKLDDLENARKHAGIAYQLKYPLPGLKNLLKNANAW